MGVTDILDQIDRQIAQLEQARAIIAGDGVATTRKSAGTTARAGKKRNLTPEGRKRIAEAVKRRWAEHRKAAAK